MSTAIVIAIEIIVFFVILGLVLLKYRQDCRRRDADREEGLRALRQAEQNDWYYGQVGKRNVIEGGKK